MILLAGKLCVEEAVLRFGRHGRRDERKFFNVSGAHIERGNNWWKRKQCGGIDNKEDESGHETLGLLCFRGIA